MQDAKPLTHFEQGLHQTLQQVSTEAKIPLSSDAIAQIVREVVTSLSGDVSAADLKFYAELEELAGYIHHAKQEIAAIQPAEISESHIPHATDELDAVVGATEEATNKIMDQCDVISTLAAECPPDVNEKLVACTTRIFEACNFQDVTGQRITKVVQTLKHIDAKIDALLKALGEEIHREGEGAEKKHELSDKDLLNGPQLPDKAMGQADIDRILSGM
ncbi:MAG: protein phosphatase CheZ [Alphaproteobacteria bacterium]|nr:protein phosphatase CheZ [Alphaproteobacteria bacterium]